MRHAPPPTPYDPQAVPRLVAAAIAAGTHSEHFETVCDACRQWVSGIYWSNDAGTRFCFDCAPASVKPPKEKP